MHEHVKTMHQLQRWHRALVSKFGMVALQADDPAAVRRYAEALARIVEALLAKEVVVKSEDAREDIRIMTEEAETLMIRTLSLVQPKMAAGHRSGSALMWPKHIDADDRGVFGPPLNPMAFGSRRRRTEQEDAADDMAYMDMLQRESADAFEKVRETGMGPVFRQIAGDPTAQDAFGMLNREELKELARYSWDGDVSDYYKPFMNSTKRNRSESGHDGVRSSVKRKGEADMSRDLGKRLRRSREAIYGKRPLTDDARPSKREAKRARSGSSDGFGQSLFSDRRRPYRFSDGRLDGEWSSARDQRRRGASPYFSERRRRSFGPASGSSSSPYLIGSARPPSASLRSRSRAGLDGGSIRPRPLAIDYQPLPIDSSASASETDGYNSSASDDNASQEL
jgi:hypothetical protein